MSPRVPPRLPPILGATPHAPQGATPPGPKAKAPAARRRPRAGEQPEERASGQGAGADAFEHAERDPREEPALSPAQRQTAGGGGQAALAAPAPRSNAQAPGQRVPSGMPPPPLSPSQSTVAPPAAEAAAPPRRAHAELNALARAVQARYEQAPATRRAQVDALFRRLP